MADKALRELADLLCALRADADLTLRELARRLHVSDSSLSRYFTAQALPPWEVVAALAELAGGDENELRAAWDTAAQTRRRSRWPQAPHVPAEPGKSAPATAPAVWEPEWPAQAPIAAFATHHRAAIAASVALLMATTAAVTYAVSPARYQTAPWTAHKQPTDSLAHQSAPASAAPKPAPTADPSPPAHPADAAQRAGAPTADRAPSPSRRSSASPSTSASSVKSGSTVALANDDPSDDTVPYVIDVANWSMDDGAPVHLWTWRTDADYRNQLWAAELISNQTWRFVNEYSGKCLDRGPGDGPLTQTNCNGGPEQTWQLGADGSLRSSADQRCMEIGGRQRLLDAPSIVADCDGGWYQSWLLSVRTSP